MTEKIETNPKASKFKLNERFRTDKYENIFSKDYTENWSIEIFIIDSVLKSNHSTDKLKELNGEKITGSFYQKELVLSML